MIIYVYKNKDFDILKSNFAKHLPNNFNHKWKYTNKELEHYHEDFGTNYFWSKGYIPVSILRNSVHGFDGVFIDQENVYLYEAKYIKDGFPKKLFESAVATALMTTGPKFDQTDDVLSKINQKSTTFTDQFDKEHIVDKEKLKHKLNDILHNIKHDVLLTTFYPKRDVIACLGTERDSALKTINKYSNSVKEYVYVKYK